MKTYVNPSSEKITEIRSKLQEYNSKYFEIEDKTTVVIDERNYNNEIIGGIVFTIVGRWLEVDFLWVHEEYRKSGLGSKLLQEAEKIAMNEQCNIGFVNTLSFQAKPFYEKHGYEVKYVQKNYPIVNSRYFMEKELV